MAFDLSVLWRAPDVNPINRKARSIPVLNPFNPYGRVFTFSWLGFMLAFWAWYVSRNRIAAFVLIFSKVHLPSAVDGHDQR
jgi:hypothetical protein